MVQFQGHDATQSIWYLLKDECDHIMNQNKKKHRFVRGCEFGIQPVSLKRSLKFISLHILSDESEMIYNPISELILVF